MIENALTRILAAMLLSLILPIQAQAQSSGLKLGGGNGNTSSAPKLDLGAAPATQPSSSAAQTNAPVKRTGQGKTTTYGAWEVACLQDDCAMAQIGQDSSGTPILEMVVRRLREPLESDGRTAIAVVDVITPLGVVLISGLELQIDGGPAEGAPFQICTEQGCLVREPVDQALVDRLKKGNNARVSVVAANQGAVSANISLSGFTKAYNSLQ